MSDRLDCIEATGYKERGGYVRWRRNGNRQMAHRFVYEQTYGKIPPSLNVLHRCDNPACINIEHLFVGSHLDNMMDKVSKHRQFIPSGECNGHAKLATDDVLAIRNDKRKQKEIAANYNISQQQVSAIKLKRFWKCLS